jgi:hypothetical protein
MNLMLNSQFPSLSPGLISRWPATSLRHQGTHSKSDKSPPAQRGNRKVSRSNQGSEKGKRNPPFLLCSSPWWLTFQLLTIPSGYGNTWQKQMDRKHLWLERTFLHTSTVPITYFLCWYSCLHLGTVWTVSDSNENLSCHARSQGGSGNQKAQQRRRETQDPQKDAIKSLKSPSACESDPNLQLEILKYTP